MPNVSDTKPKPQILTIDLEKIKPDAEKMKNEKRKNTVINGGILCSLGAVMGYVIGLESKSPYSKYLYGSVGGITLGALGAYMGAYEKSNEEKTYDFLADATSNNGQDIHKKLKKLFDDHDAEIAMTALL